MPLRSAFAKRLTPHYDGMVIAGHSGCKIDIVDRDGAVAIRKTASDIQYNQRLKLQIEKQRRFAEMRLPQGVRVPFIIAEAESENGLFSAEMEYVYFQPSIIAFESISITDIARIATLVFNFIDFEIEYSPLQRLQKSIIIHKIESVEKTLAAAGIAGRYQEEIELIRYRLHSIDENIDVPIGLCHGDMTFSNIMVSSDKSSIALIDFLDSFIESPLIDIVKLRQDTLLYWSLLMGKTPLDNLRIKHVLKYIDDSLLEKYRSFRWFSSLSDIFLAINLLRIAPYAVDESVHRFVLESMRRVR